MLIVVVWFTLSEWKIAELSVIVPASPFIKPVDQRGNKRVESLPEHCRRLCVDLHRGEWL